MAIFNSYVKLPEGNFNGSIIKYSNQLLAARLPWTGSKFAMTEHLKETGR